MRPRIMMPALVLMGAAALTARAQDPRDYRPDMPGAYRPAIPRDYRYYPEGDRRWGERWERHWGRPSDNRVEWDYIDGSFRMVGPRHWEERNPDGSYSYDELQRTPEFVEIYDRNRHLIVRLCSGYLLQRAEDAERWSKGYTGNWR